MICGDPDFAKRKFAEMGEFCLEGEEPADLPACIRPIPRTVKFKIYEADDGERHNLALFVLPAKDKPLPTDPTKIWLAAWQPWKS